MALVSMNILSRSPRLAQDLRQEGGAKMPTLSMRWYRVRKNRRRIPSMQRPERSRSALG